MGPTYTARQARLDQTARRPNQWCCALAWAMLDNCGRFGAGEGVERKSLPSGADKQRRKLLRETALPTRREGLADGVASGVRRQHGCQAPRFQATPLRNAVGDAVSPTTRDFRRDGGAFGVLREPQPTGVTHERIPFRMGRCHQHVNHSAALSWQHSAACNPTGLNVLLTLLCSRTLAPAGQADVAAQREIFGISSGRGDRQEQSPLLSGRSGSPAPRSKCPRQLGREA